MVTADVDLKPCEKLLGRELKGEKRPGVWRVIERIERQPGATGGTFSIGYRAIHEDGTEAFVKATDIGLLKRNSSESPLKKMVDALTEQKFERAILDICKGANMDRVVHALDYGEYETVEGGVRDYVFYIMFEMAKGDVRIQADKQKRLGLEWSIHALHNVAVSIQQLHAAKIAHNDVKPSNVLIFGEYLQKLADLGRATSDLQIGPWDSLKYCGDRRYAAPEFWYNNVRFPHSGGKIYFDVRRASDLYLLGSMGFFLVAGEALSPVIKTALRPEHSPMNWSGGFDEVLPYVRDAFGEAMKYFDAELPRNDDAEFTKEAVYLRRSVIELCEPDPSKRGHPKNIATGGDRFGVERYISLFDRLAKTVTIMNERSL